jgi:hypothetical protein
MTTTKGTTELLQLAHLEGSLSIRNNPIQLLRIWILCTYSLAIIATKLFSKFKSRIEKNTNIILN